MIPSRSIHWRIAAAYTALVILVTGAVVVMLVAVPQDEPSIGWVLATAATVTVIGGVTATALAHTLTRSSALTTQALTTAIDRLAEGDLDQRVRPGARVRTSDITSSFNLMADTIRETVRDLEAEHDLLAVVMDTMADGVVVLDQIGRISLINSAAQRMLESDARAAQDRPLAAVVRDHEILELASVTASSRQIHQVEVELLHSRRFLHVIATPTSGDLGPGVLLTLQDVTDFRQLQTTRREFVSNVSHELRSPLASVRAMVETLEAGALDDRTIAIDFIGRIQSEIERMTTLVDELLELSRLESGQVSLHLAPVSLIKTVDEVVERFSSFASERDVDLRRSIDADLPYVLAEEGKLDQIITNLVQNAIKFTPEGGSVTLLAEYDPRWVELTVVDTGVGIPREHLPHVFERFYKVDRSRRDSGTGLGLAIVKYLVQAHGGDIDATSSEGEGSAFTLKIRRAT